MTKIQIALGLHDSESPNTTSVLILEKQVGDGEQIPMSVDYDGTHQGAVEAAQSLIAAGFRVVTE